MSKKKSLPVRARQVSDPRDRAAAQRWRPLSPKQLQDRIEKLDEFKQRIDVYFIEATAQAATPYRLNSLMNARTVAFEIATSFEVESEVRLHASVAHVAIGQLLDKLQKAVEQLAEASRRKPTVSKKKLARSTT